MTELRPHQQALRPDEAARALSAHVPAGRIDPAAGARLFVMPARVAEVPLLPRDRVGDDGRRGVVQIVLGEFEEHLRLQRCPYKPVPEGAAATA